MITRAEIEAVSATDPEVLDPELWDTRFGGGPPIGVRQAIVAHRRLVAQEKAAAEQRQNGDADVADLHRRVAALEHTLADDGDFTRALVEGVGSVLPRFVDKRFRESLPTLTGELTAKVNALAEKVADLEQRQLRFKGVWREGNVYEANSLVIKRGGLWIAKATTITPPGSSDDWCLCTKSGEVVPKEPVCA
jgi:hypothetical protein